MNPFEGCPSYPCTPDQPVTRQIAFLGNFVAVKDGFVKSGQLLPVLRHDLVCT